MDSAFDEFTRGWKENLRQTFYDYINFFEIPEELTLDELKAYYKDFTGN